MMPLPSREWNTGLVKLNDDVYAYLQAKGSWGLSNAGAINGKEVTIVDTLLTIPMTATFLAEVRTVISNPVKHLIITHHHSDHCFAAHLLSGAVNYAHVNARSEMIRKGQPDPATHQVLHPEGDFTGVRFTLPHVTFSDRLDLHLEERSLSLHYFGAAHTIADIAVQLPSEGIVFAGDLLFLYSTPVAIEGSISGWIAALDKLAALDAESYVPGHGPICGRDGVIASRDYLQLIYEAGKQGFNAGWTARETAVRTDIGAYKRWANPERIIANMERLWREFRGEEPISNMGNPQTLISEMNEIAKQGYWA
ncbi:MAG: Zn-dependent hydrolase, including glyoxylase [Firmicutes bacterium]|nr:Zn-dependent hydrolase, including glyoxylase [Bacillota bacterium]